MLSGYRLLTSLTVCCALTGCAGNDLMLKRQSESEAKLEQLIQSGKKSELRVNELAERLKSQEEKAKAEATQIVALQESIRELRTSHEEFKARLTLLSKQTATPKVEVVNQEPTPKGKESGPPSEYVKAFGLYSANNFDAAIPAFEAFIKDNPNSDYVANALYWIGECHYSKSELPKAKEYFFKVAGNYPNSPKAPDSLLKLGYTLTAMKEKEKAAAIFESLIKSYPSSPAAAKARERLTAN